MKLIHLNKKANKHYNPQSFINLITQRLNEGYTFEDFQYVIDIKVSQWLHDEKMNAYLRPYTLFKYPNFEKYLQEEMKQEPNNHYQPVELDFTAGEDAPRLKWL